MARSSGPRQAAALRTVAKAAEARERRSVNPFAHQFQREAFDWVGVDAAVVVDGIASSIGAGSAVTISATADGGAIKVSVWVGDQKYAAYAATPELLNELFFALSSPEQAVDEARAT